MALEMRVYDELTAVDPKIIANLTFRQLGAVLLLLLIGGGTVAALWLTGHREWMQIAVIAITIPIAMWGWLKPKGLRPEVYLRHVWGYLRRPRRLYYQNVALWTSQQRASYGGQNVVSNKRARRIDEASN